MLYTWKSLKGFKLLEANSKKPRSMYSIKLQWSLYELKQFGHMSYNHFSEYLLKEGYVNNPICPCIFIKKSETEFAIIAVYVDYLLELPKSSQEQQIAWKRNFRWKILEKQNFVSACKSSIFQMKF